MKVSVAIISILFVSSVAFAGETCESKAAAKKLVGVAETSFMKRCKADTKAANTCAGGEANAKDKNMTSVAKDSLLKIFFGLQKI